MFFVKLVLIKSNFIYLIARQLTFSFVEQTYTAEYFHAEFQNLNLILDCNMFLKSK